MSNSSKRLIAALAFVLPVAGFVASPVLAASHATSKTHHTSIHKASAHKSHKKSVSTTS